MENPAHKHHYIPKCYLRQWTGADEMLCEYKRPHDRVVVRRVYPSQTGWTDRLYVVDALPPEHAAVLEQRFFARVDQDASDALKEFTSNRLLMTQRLRTGWSRFMMSLMQRHPGKVAELKRMARDEFIKSNDGDPHRKDYAAQRSPTDPETYEEYCALNFDKHVALVFADSLKTVCDLETAGQHLNNMDQRILTLQWTTKRFMTSDNPLIINKGLAHDDCFIMIPISPRKLFVASNVEKYTDQLLARFEDDSWVDRVNAQVIGQSYRTAHDICENQVEFADQYWPKTKPDSYMHLKAPPGGFQPNGPSVGGRKL